MPKSITNLSEWDDLDWAADSAKRAYFGTRKHLAEQARSLAKDMTRLAERLEHTDPVVNSCGEVQGKGPEIDRLCAVLAEQRKAAEALQRLVAKRDEESGS